VTAGGLGRLDATDLQKVLSGKIATVNPFINELQEGLNGQSSRKDVETMFQLIYLRFTQPRADPTALKVLAEQTRADMANLTANPDFAFSRALASVSYQDHLRRRLATAQTVDEWNLEKSFAFYKERFADASDFTFVFVGSFDIDAMKPLVERYLASLPSIGRKETWRDVGVRRPAGVVEKTVEQGIDPRSRTTIVFSGAFVDDDAHRVALQAMTDVLSRRLLEVIREQLGSVYTITAGQSVQKIPNPEYAITIQLGHDPKRTEDLVGRILREIDRLKTDGPTAAQVNDEKEALRRTFDTNIKQNGYLLNQITPRYRFGEDPALVWSLRDYYDRIDAAAIQQAAKTYLDTGRYVRVTLVPEKK
jgi:zinc protease